MLNFTLKPGDYFMIGDDIKVVMAGGTANNCRIMVEAPREYNIVRSRVLEKQAVTQNEKRKNPQILSGATDSERRYPEIYSGTEGRKTKIISQIVTCRLSWGFAVRYK